jgi:hypothetical protein
VKLETYTCDYCQNIFKARKGTRRGITKFCNRECKSSYQKGRNLGAENPNFNNRWSDERKGQFSESKKEHFANNPEARYKCGANRGKRFSDDVRTRMSEGQTGKLAPSKPHTESSKRLIGEKSKAKWTDEYKAKHRKMMEDLGHWIKREDISDRDVYFKQSNWIARMYDIIDNKSFLTYGVWSYKNKTGLVRDHKYSRKSGFLNGVFPEILHHPCNCRLITHKENLSSAQKQCGKFDDVITLDELFEYIVNYKQGWIEQELAIEMIDKYKQGIRWSRG